MRWKKESSAALSLGFVVGIGFALLFLIWAVPQFRLPIDSRITEEQYGVSWPYWLTTLVKLEDTLAQWLMAIISLLATVASIVAVVLVKRTLDATREVGRDQSRAYIHADRAQFTLGGFNAENPRIALWVKNTGSTPAKWFAVRSLVLVKPIDATRLTFATLDIDDFSATRWNALGGGLELSLPINIGDAAEEIRNAYHRKREAYSLWVAGVVRYETFFSEVFETEFLFVRRGLPQQIIETARKTGAGDLMEETPHSLQRGSGELRSYRRIDGKQFD